MAHQRQMEDWGVCRSPWLFTPPRSVHRRWWNDLWRWRRHDYHVWAYRRSMTKHKFALLVLIEVLAGKFGHLAFQQISVRLILQAVAIIRAETYPSRRRIASTFVDKYIIHMSCNSMYVCIWSQGPRTAENLEKLGLDWPESLLWNLRTSLNPPYTHIFYGLFGY